MTRLDFLCAHEFVNYIFLALGQVSADSSSRDACNSDENIEVFTYRNCLGRFFEVEKSDTDDV